MRTLPTVALSLAAALLFTACGTTDDADPPTPSGPTRPPRPAPSSRSATCAGACRPMGMRQIPAIQVPAGQQVELVPGGLHLMVMDLVDDLEVGDEFELVLEFEQSDPVTVTVEVREDVRAMAAGPRRRAFPALRPNRGGEPCTRRRTVLDLPGT